MPPTAVPPTAAPAPTTFIFGSQGEPVCLDPAIITDGISGRVTNQIFEGLVKYDKDTTNVVASLAEKWDIVRRRQDVDVHPAQGREVP